MCVEYLSTFSDRRFDFSLLIFEHLIFIIAINVTARSHRKNKYILRYYGDWAVLTIFKSIEHDYE